MFFSFLNRLLQRKEKRSELPKPMVVVDTTDFITLVQLHHGYFFSYFKLFYRDTYTLLDLLLFFPHKGIYLGEMLTWTDKELHGSTIERSSKRTTKPSTTHFDSKIAIIEQKLQDVLSFDSTPIVRFVWLPNLSESEFDSLDPSFHTFLPKHSVIFKNEEHRSILDKFDAMISDSNPPFSTVKVLGSLKAHTLLLPDNEHPFGHFLNDEQLHFLAQPLDKTIQLHGDFGSGKTTVMIRKVLSEVLEDRDLKVIILTPSRLSGELIRNDLIALIEYSVLNVPLSSFLFYIPEQFQTQEFDKHLHEKVLIVCDDTNRIPPEILQELVHRYAHQNILLSVNELLPIPSTIYRLTKCYHNNTRHFLLRVTESALIPTLLNDIRKRLDTMVPSQILVVIDDPHQLSHYKTAIAEYLHCECRVVTTDFSLQYQNLDALLLSTPELISGLKIAHLYLIGAIRETIYPFILSRASETATIISTSN